MAEEITLKIILTIVGFITTGTLGYLSGKVKNYKETEKKREEEHRIFKKTLNCLLRSNITSKLIKFSILFSLLKNILLIFSNIFTPLLQCKYLTYLPKIYLPIN